MGEFADDAVARTLGEYGYFSRPHRRPSSAPREVTCNRCDRSDLYWHPNERGGGYRLMNPNGTPHICGAVAPTSDFDDLTNPPKGA